MQKIIAFILFFAGSANARAFSGLELYANPAQPSLVSATLTWRSQEHVCEIKRSGAKLSLKLKTSDCKNIDEFLIGRQAELKKLSEAGFTAEKRRKIQGIHLPFAEIEVQGMKLGILKIPAENCDEFHKSCRPSSRLSADQLGFKVLALFEKLP